MTQPHSPESTPHEEGFQLGPIPLEEEAQNRRGWTVEINDEEYTGPLSSVRILQEKMGLDLHYGQHPAGYDVWTFHEPGGGGAVTVPYAIIEGTLMIGVVAQNRPTTGGVIEEIPRGFMDIGETHEDAATRELHEETGLNAVKSRLEKLGDQKNPNTAFFNTSKEGEGISFYGVQVQPEELQKIEDDDGKVHYEFTTDIQAQAEGDKTAERIVGSRFITIQEAVESKDLMTAAGAGLLTANLLGKRILKVGLF